MPKVSTDLFIWKAKDAGLLPDVEITAVDICFDLHHRSWINYGDGNVTHGKTVDGLQLMKELRKLITNLPPALTQLRIIAELGDALQIEVKYFGEMDL